MITSRTFLLLLGLSFGSSYIIPSDDIVADVQINDLNDPKYFTYKVRVVLGNSEEFDVIGSTADGKKDITVVPARGGPKTKYVRQEVTNTVENGKPVIKLVIKSTVRNLQKKIKYNGLTTITYRAFQDVQWFTDHEAVGVLNYKGKGCDPDDLECNEEEEEIAPEGQTPPPIEETRDEGPAWGGVYNYVYSVDDSPSQNLYSRTEESNGDVIKGVYRTLLPDGRTQVVEYTADWKNGYVPNVRYEGNIKF